MNDPREGVTPVSFEAVLEILAREFPLGPRSLHGPELHWRNVERFGVALARRTPSADERVVRWFSIFHDCQRDNEYHDPQHGARGAARAREMHAALDLTSAQLDTLVYACTHHTDGTTSSDPTIGACWDADRLDLPRVGYTLDVRYLSTPAARAFARGERTLI
ncbi:hypothetical protein [Deinococcus yavapaiensis]|uniref:HD domain-containing protein n=1 Tax=Deinococcus yavapaiensis KR-236 TaxID=694435 RepID=A0A318S2D2_9DEIO|nr:hypothetical protein [Deinococcus yavapaiensis]PYE51997.1 uncharacterized protein DES52_11343 [Deinococcus yavapaiensis KR-236]